MRRSLALVVLALVCVTSGAAATTPREPIFPLVSPTGTRMAWVEGSTWQIWIAHTDGSSAHVFGPSFPQGIGQIAWTTHGMVVGSNYTLFRLSASGKRMKLAVVADQFFSTGGTRAAAGSGQGNGPVTVVDLLTRKVTRIGSPRAANGEPSLAPDGRRLAWAGPGGIWVAPSTGGNAHLLVGNAGCPSWSPNGRSIAYLAHGDLHVIAPTGGRAKKLAVRAGGCANVTWSPDSKTIAFAPERIDTVNVATAHVSRSPSLGRVAGGLAWSRDHSALYVSTRPLADEQALNNCTNLWRLDAKTLTGSIVVRGCP